MGFATNLRPVVGSSIEKLTHQGKYEAYGNLARSSYFDLYHNLSGQSLNFGQSVETDMTHLQSGGKSPRDFAGLEAEITGTLGLRGSRVFTEGTRVFYPPARHCEPLAVVRPTDVTDVATVFRRATAEGFRVTVRSGGHCFDGFPIQENTVLLDLSHMNDARLYADGRLHAGPGARILDLAKDLDASRRAVPTGDCPTVALGGLVSGGGLGYATRMLGLTMDNLVEAVVVTADGEIHRVSQDQNPDLFWMCRGGAGTAGVMTEMVLRTFAVERVTAVEMAWNWDDARNVILAFDTVMRGAPRELDLKLKFRTTGADRFLDMASEGPPDAVPGVPLVHIDGQYLGSRTGAEVFLKPLLDHPALTGLTIREESYFAAMQQLNPLPTLTDSAPETLRPTRVASDFVAQAIREKEADVIIGFVEDIQYAPDLWGGGMLIEPCGGVVREIEPGESAYPHRNQRMIFEWEMCHPLVCSSEQVTRLDKCLLKARNGLSHLISGGRYVNYPDRLDTPSDWWLTNTDRLKALSDHFNPHGTLVTRLKPA